jgi:hypothetical protein
MMEFNEITNPLIRAFEVQSILCYGSFAQMLQDEKSDIDLLVLTQENIPTVDLRKSAYSNIPGTKILALDNEAKKDGGEWDISWAPINDKIQVGSRVVEIGYNTTTWVNCIIDNLIVKSKITFKEFPFRPYTFLGLLETAMILYDKADFIKQCKLRIRTMPKELKNEIINAFLPVLTESYNDLADCAERNIGILAFQFYLFRGLDAAIQLLFAINEVYDPASKRCEPFLLKLKKLPKNFAAFINEILPRFYENKKEVCQFFEELIHFINKNK